MTPDKENKINLLPGELQRKREVIKKAIATQPVEYTEAPAEPKSARFGFGNGTKVFSTKLPIAPPPTIRPAKSESGSWWRKLFGRKKTVAAEPVKPLTPPPASPAGGLTPPQRGGDKQDKPPSPPVTVPPPSFSPLDHPPSASAPPSLKLRGASADKPTPPSVPSPPSPPDHPPTPSLVKEGERKQTEVSKASKIIETNLLAGEYAQAFVPQNQKSFFLTAVGLTVLAVILGYAGVWLYQLSQESSTREVAQINEELKKTIATYAPLETEDKALQKKVTAIKGLLGSHVSFKNFLEQLEAVTIPEVTYTMIALSKSGDMSLTALATNYTALARQLTVLQTDAPWVEKAVVTSAALARDNQAHTRGVEFEISLKVDPAVFVPIPKQ